MDKGTSLIDHSCVSEEFFGSVLFRELGNYKGPKEPRALISDYVDMETACREEDARKGGTLPLMQPSETIRPKLMKSLSEYVSLITRVGDFVCDKASEQFEGEGLSVIQVRTGFDFTNWLVRLLFVIDAGAEEAASFERLLRIVEMVVLEEERFTAELRFLNRRDQRADYKRVFRAYPFIRAYEDS
jgi:hypothetical protein